MPLQLCSKYEEREQSPKKRHATYEKDGHIWHICPRQKNPREIVSKFKSTPLKRGHKRWTCSRHCFKKPLISQEYPTSTIRYLYIHIATKHSNQTLPAKISSYHHASGTLTPSKQHNYKHPSSPRPSPYNPSQSTYQYSS